MTTIYCITKEEQRIVRELARAAGIDWKTIAARPMEAEFWCACYRDCDQNVRETLDRIRWECPNCGGRDCPGCLPSSQNLSCFV